MLKKVRNIFLAAMIPGMVWFGSNAAGQEPNPGSLQIMAGPYLQNVSITGITIMWETNLASDSEVVYGRNTPLVNNVKLDEKKNIHEVTLSNLEVETTYFYYIKSDAGVSGSVKSDRFTFQTAVKPDTAYAFVVIGDNRSFPERFKKISDLAYGERPNFAVNVGDVVTDGRVKEQWITEFLNPAANLMARVPNYVAIGNHEKNAHWFYDYLSFPAPENYYSFDYGNAHFTIVDSNQIFTPLSRQYQWLEKDLAASRATWKFVAHHHPPYSSDKDDYGNTDKRGSILGDPNTRQLVSLYEKYGVDIVWVGHIHDYERTWPIRDGRVDQEHGVIYIQTGGGGAELEDFAPTRSWFTAKVLRNFQYCYVAVSRGTLRMMAYDLDGRLYDYLELKK